MGACHHIAVGIAVLAVSIATPVQAHSFVLTHDVVPVPGGTLAVSGRIETQPLSVDLVGRATQWKFGALVLRDVVATARDHGAQIRACLTGWVGTAKVRACTSVPRSVDAIRELRGIGVTLAVAGGATGTGTARLAWGTGGHGLRVEHGHVDLALVAQPGNAIDAGGVSLQVDANGTLSPLALAVTGDARSEDITVGPVRVRDGALPIAATLSTGPEGELVVTPRGSVVAKARELEVRAGTRTLVATTPELLVHDARPFVPAALLGDVHVLSAPSIAGLPVDARDGAFAFRILPEGVLLEHARVRALGAELVADRVMFDGGPFELSIAARGVSLDRVLPAVTRGKLGGTGVLDGRIVVRDGDEGVTLRSAVLHARRAGTVQVRGYDWSTKALAPAIRSSLHRRIAGTLADFGYDGLCLELAPPGADPEARLVMRGRGRRLAQELDLVINLRGARDAATHLLQRTGS